MPEYTEDQKNVINFDKTENLLVSASAGSGKTTIMIERIIKLITEGKASVKRLLVTTFTNAAAQSIVNKLNDALDKKIKESSGAEKQRLQNELDYLPNASIGTLHSWCSKIIRKYFYETEDDPAFDIIQEEYDFWLMSLAEDIIEEKLESGDADPDFEALYKSYLTKRSSKKLAGILAGIVKSMENIVDPEDWLEKCLDCYEDGSYETEYMEYAKSVKKKIDYKVFVLLNDMNASGIKPEAVARTKEIIDIKFAGDSVSFNPIKGMDEKLKNRRAEIGEDIKKYLEITEKAKLADNGKVQAYAGVLRELASELLKRITDKKKNKGVLTFSDLEHKTLKILCSGSAEDIVKSYDFIFVDEYQDINPVQNAIITKLINGNACFIGDVKQSIYGFRGCSASAFTEKRSEYSSGGSGTVIDLKQNFRCSEGILTFCDDVFSKAMTEKFGGSEYKKYPFLEKGNLSDGSVEIVQYGGENAEGDDGDEKSGSAGRRNPEFEKPFSVKEAASAEPEIKPDWESDAIVSRINGLIDEGWTPDDIVILVRNRSNASKFVPALVNAGYPVSIDAKLSLSDNRAVMEILGYLSVINNYRDDVSLLTAMRSMYGGFSDEELLKIRSRMNSKKKIFFYDCVKNYAKESDDLGFKIRTFISELEDYEKLSKIVSVSELLGKITSDKKIFTKLLMRSDGPNDSRILGFLLEYSEKFSGMLPEFLQALSDCAPETKTVSVSGTIRIITMHQSKGLEFPVVLLAGLEKTFQKKDTNSGVHVMVRNDCGLATEIPEEDDDPVYSYPLLCSKLRKDNENLQEEMRLLYVAMTRAQKKLVIFLDSGRSESRVAPEDATKYADWLRPMAALLPEKHAAAAATAPDRPGETPAACENAAGNSGSSNEEIPADEIRKIVVDRLPEGKDIKKSVTSVLSALTEEENWKSIYGKEYENTSSMERGTACHKALETVDYSVDFDMQVKEMLKKIPGLTAGDGPVLAAAFNNMLKEINGRKIYREKPFIYRAGSDDPELEEGLLVQGVIDLLIVGDENEIIDYKTGTVNDDRKKKYALQLELYKKAAEKITGLKISRTRIYLIDECRFMDEDM